MPEIKDASINHVLLTGRKEYGFDGTNWRPISVDTSGSVKISNVETIQTELFASASIAASSQATSSVLTLTGIKKAAVFIDHGRAATTAFGTQGTEYLIQASQQASNNDTWRTIASVVAGSTAALLVSHTAIVAADTTVTVTSGTSIPSRGDTVMGITGTVEWMKVLSVTGTASFVVEDGATFAHAAAGSIYTQAENFVLTLNTEALTRMRVRINNNASGTTYAVFSRIAAITEQ